MPIHNSNRVEFAIDSGYIEIVTDSGKKVPAYWAHPRIGHRFSGQYRSRGDRDPSAVGVYKLKDDVDGRPAGIFKFDLDTGKLIKKYILETKGKVHFFNDLILDTDGNVYITHMFQEHSIYTIQKEKDELEIFLKPESLKYPNGISISNDDRFLFVAHSEGLSRIEIATKIW